MHAQRGSCGADARLPHRVLMENGERLAALAAVRDCEHHLLGARASRSISASLAALQSAINQAGHQCMPQVQLSPVLAAHAAECDDEQACAHSKAEEG